jgi:hypothetical protein
MSATHHVRAVTPPEVAAQGRLVAAWLGETRLIDNVRVLPRQSIDGFSRNPGIAAALQVVPDREMNYSTRRHDG